LASTPPKHQSPAQATWAKHQTMMLENSTCGLPTWTSEWKRQYEGEPGNFPSGDPGNRMQVPSEHYRRLQRWSPSSGTLEVARRRPVVPTGTSRTRVRREIAIVVAVRKYIDQNANIWRPLQQRHLVSFRVRSESGQQKELHSQRPFSGSIRVHFGSIGVISRFFWLNRSLSGRTRPSHRGCGWRPSSATNPSC